MEFSTRYRVYIEDTDTGGIVYYVNYLKFMERARTDWLRALGFQHLSLRDDHTLFVVRHVDIRYHASAKIDDELTVTVEPVKVGGARLVFQQNITRLPDNLLLCTAKVDVACIDSESRAPKKMPTEIRLAIKDFDPHVENNGS